MIGKITKRCISEIQDHLKDYVMEHSTKNKNRKFTCFNKNAHSHNDEDPSAAFVPGSGGRYWSCFSCGAKGDILTAARYKEGVEGFHNSVKFLSSKYNIKIETEDPVTAAKCDFEPKQNMSSSYANNKSNNYNDTYKIKDDDFKNSSKRYKTNFHKDITANYYYEDELGITLYKLCRREWMDNGKRKKDFIAYTKANSNWSFGIRSTRHVIYKLPRVLEGIKSDKTIFFVEGEKCADEILRLGQIATTTPFGARGFSAYSEDYVASLIGANIVILPDNDESGNAYAKDILSALKNEAKSIKIIELPGLKLKEDIVDWVGNGGTLEELITLVNATDETFVDNGTVQDKPIGNIYEVEFCYYKYYKDQIINVSNFIINPKYYIENEGDTEIIVDIVMEEGVVGERTFKTSDFDDVLSFRRALNSFKTFYIGRVEDLQYIRFIVSSKTRNSSLKQNR